MKPAHAAPPGAWPAAALVFNAFVWGTSWWPLRRLQEAGLHPLWATAFTFLLASAVIVALRPAAVRQVATTPALWVLVAAAGTTNASFNWAVVIGDVVRVVLLFYLMPIWAALLARVLLGERLTVLAWLRIAIGVAGAAIVLWPEGAGSGAAEWPRPHSLADWLGIVGGFSFALNNVMLRREAHRAEEGRALAMFAGGAIVAAVLATTQATSGTLPWPPAPAWNWVPLAVGVTACFLFGNLALQYAAARLTASRTAVIALTEVVFAAASAIAWGAGEITWRRALGGGMIVAAAALATLMPQRTR